MTAMIALLLLTAASGSNSSEVLAVRMTSANGRTSLQVLTTSAPSEAEAHREDGEVVVVLSAKVPESLSLPAPLPPIEAMRLVREDGRVALRITVAPEVPFELRREETVVTVRFGELTLAETVPSEALPTEDLYAKLFPGGPEEAPKEALAEGERQGEGLWLGIFRLRPAVVLSYVDADVASSETGAPVRERYFEVQPSLGLNVGVSVGGGGRIRASYEPRLRPFTSHSALRQTSHFVDAGVEVTIAQRLDLSGRYHFARGVLEANEVDPGREYFFPLGRFTHHDAEAEARYAMTPRLGLEASAAFARVAIEQPAGFSGYDREALRAGFGYEIGPNTRSSVGYERQRVSAAPDRPFVEADADSVFLGVRTDRGPALSGQAEVSWRDQRNPRAAAPGQRFRGLNFSANLRRALGTGTAFDLGGRRATDVSGFEDNGFYVSSSLQAGVTVPLPWELSLRGSAVQVWNRYRLPAAAIGAPREDDIFGWSVGLGRSFGRRAFLRADYRRDHRNSNLPGFDLQTHGFVLQLGLGLFPEHAGR